MIALYILAFIVLITVLLCMVKLRLFASYSGELSLQLKVLFLSFTLVPYKKKEKKKSKKKIPKKKKGAKGKDNKEDKKKKPSYLKKLSDKKGVTGLISMISDLAKLATSTLKGIFTNIVIEKFDVSISIVGEDAADTALKYGKLCGVFYSAFSVICDNVKKCDNYNVSLNPDFDDEAQAKAHADVRFYIRTFYVLKYALGALLKLLRIRYKR